MAYSLRQNCPNPFNPITTIRFDLPEPNRVVLRVYNVSGRQVRTLVDRPYDAGYHSVIWDGRDDQGRPVASGVYFCAITVGVYEQSKKMVLLK
jgi:flagellar hook assembly protein FlgD